MQYLLYSLWYTWHYILHMHIYTIIYIYIHMFSYDTVHFSRSIPDRQGTCQVFCCLTPLLLCGSWTSAWNHEGNHGKVMAVYHPVPSHFWVINLPKKIKGPDNRTSQLLPIINEKTKVEAGRGRKERQRRWWRIDKLKNSSMWKSFVCVLKRCDAWGWNSCVWGSCEIVVYECEQVVCEKAARKRVVYARVACATVLRDKAGLPSDALESRAGRSTVARTWTDRPVPRCVPRKAH